MLHFLFGFKGRVSLLRFWAFYIGSGLVLSAMFLAITEIEQAISTDPPFGFLDGTWPRTPTGWVAAGIMVGLYLLFVYAWLAMIAKRLHDRNKSAWYLTLIYGAPIGIFAAIYGGAGAHILNYGPFSMVVFGLAGLIAMRYMFEVIFLPGTRGDNRFGPDPRVKKPAN